MAKAKVTISKGNIKMGDIKSVSLPAIATCAIGVPCTKDCYALRMERRFKTVKISYYQNLTTYLTEPHEYENAIMKSALTQNVFRYHVSGDIVDMEYLIMMNRIAKNCPNTKFFAFTKKFDLVNEYIEKNGMFEKNLVIIFSAWQGLELKNPYNLPVAHVIEKDGTSTAETIANVCPGHCIECLANGTGCWNLKYGEIVCFGKH